MTEDIDRSNRKIPSRHLQGLATLLSTAPLSNLDFVTGTLEYLARWQDGEVDAGPNGPTWVHSGEPYEDDRLSNRR
jgi:hypothetical protein